jgi:gliding motility-associated-like protein
VVVKVPPSIAIRGINSICEGSHATLTVTGEGTHVWSTGETNEVITVSPIRTTNYSVTSTSNGCSSQARFEVSVTSIQVELGDPIDLCSTGATTLDARNKGSRFLWNTGDTTQIIKIDEPGFYSVNVTRSGCSAIDNIQVTGDVLGKPDFFVPNSFTPNGDGLNDCFSPKGVNITALHLEIYDRWGELVYRTEDLDSHCWDGYYMGKVVQDGIYVWVLRYKTVCTHAKLFEKVGHVVILK